MERIVSDDGSLSLVSARYGQGYRSSHGARSETWHVFVAGSGIAARLAAGRASTVLEIGLGTARNLAASAALALAFDAPLRYVACEHDLLSAEAWASLEPDALGPATFRDALLAARGRWERELGRIHTLRVGPVTLEVHVGDAREAAWPQGVDAVYLDAFSPAVNPELWTPAVLQRVAAHLAPGGTVVSYCVRGSVRRALTEAGLRVERRAGPPGGKREVLWAQRPGPEARRLTSEARRPLAATRVAVVGAGVAGRSLAWAAARAGAHVTVFDAGDGLGGASGVPAALVNPYRGRSGRASDDDLAGAERTWTWAARLAAAGFDTGAHPGGVVRVADHARQAQAWRVHARTVPFGPELDPAPGRWRAPHGGMLVPRGGWIDPARWLAALRGATAALGGVEHTTTRVVSLAPAAGRWRLALAGPSAPPSAHDPYDLVALCLGAGDPGTLPHLSVDAVVGSVALVPGHLPARALAGAVYAAPLTSPARFALDPRRAWFAVGGGHGVQSADPDGLLAALGHALPPPAADAGPPKVSAHWRGARARGSDPQPQVAPLASGVWWFGAFAGRGYLRAALEAERLVTRWAAGPD